MSEPNKNSVANTLRGFRTHRDLSQQAMAELLGVTQTTISNWERGLTEPIVSEWRRVREILAKRRQEERVEKQEAAK
jgi:transcriptional regulator with XRE-family HTH domain